MADILSQEEINALLSVTEGNYVEDEEPLSEYVYVCDGSILRKREDVTEIITPKDIPDDENVIEGIKGWLSNLELRMDKVEETCRGLDDAIVDLESDFEEEDEMDPLAVEMLKMMEDEDDDEEPTQAQINRMMEMEMLKAMEEEGGVSSKLTEKLIKKAPVENTEEIELEISDELFMKLAYMAHEQDITLNQLINNILRARLEE